MLGPLRPGGCWEKAESPPEDQSDPLRAEPPWVLPAAPSPVPSGSLGSLGSAQWSLHPRVIIPVQNWGPWLCPRASGTSLPIYFRPVSWCRAGLGFQSGSSVPLLFQC